MLTLVDQSGNQVEVDTTKLDEDAPVILYNDGVASDGSYRMLDFDPVNDLGNARFLITFSDGSEAEFNWADQSDDAQIDIAQLDEPS
jgi:hypothetical protein